ncbi:hypothetical protein KEG57_41405 [Polyangium jinanense]|uniref:Uncharacterized protein n=2 Tax=Polyangium jinanense TaxID=2829994 RepID=A0A9X3XDG2_9BACT|nr:hypothetical protein [Polyangium jinanense]
MRADQRCRGTAALTARENPDSMLPLDEGGMIHGTARAQPRFAEVHPTNLTPSVAVLAVGLWTAAGALLGEAILVPVTEVGSLASAVGWMSACAAYFRLQPAASQRLLALAGMLVSAALVLMKLLPFVPGSFTWQELVALAAWLVAGLVAAFRARGAGLQGSMSRTEA